MAFGVFLLPMSAALEWSRADIAIATLLNSLFMGAGSFLWGALSDRLGTRLVLLCGGFLLAAGFAIASQAATLLQFQLAFGVIAGFAAGSFYAPLIATATSWFTTNRSLAIALVSAGIGVASATVAPFARTNHDWRFAMLALGGAALVVILPAALLVPPRFGRHRPGCRGGRHHIPPATRPARRHGAGVLTSARVGQQRLKMRFHLSLGQAWMRVGQ